MDSIRITTNVNGIASAIRADAARFSSLMQATMRRAMLEYAQTTRYSPPPPLPTYQRTYNLLNGLTPFTSKNIFEARVNGGIAVGVFGTTVSYAQWVIDKDRQAWMHIGRWWTLRSKADDAMPQISALFEKEIRDFIQDALDDE